MLLGQQRFGEPCLEQAVVGLERSDLALVPDPRLVAVHVERADRSPQARRHADHGPNRPVGERGTQFRPARLGREIVRLHARVEDERIDTGALARLLVCELEFPRDLVTRGHVAQRVAILRNEHEADARAGEDAGSAAHDPRDAALDVDFLAVGQIEVGEAPCQRFAVDMLCRLAHRGMYAARRMRAMFQPTPRAGSPHERIA